MICSNSALTCRALFDGFRPLSGVSSSWDSSLIVQASGDEMISWSWFSATANCQRKVYLCTNKGGCSHRFSPWSHCWNQSSCLSNTPASPSHSPGSVPEFIDTAEKSNPPSRTASSKMTVW